MCVCVRERESEGRSERGRLCERERERERKEPVEGGTGQDALFEVRDALVEHLLSGFGFQVEGCGLD